MGKAKAAGAAEVAGKERIPVRKKAAVGVVCVVCALVLAAGASLVLMASAVVFPPGMAAKYGMLSYIAEDDVTNYISTYRAMSGCGEDEAWAQQLADEGHSPASLRVKTVKQLVADDLLARKADELGVTVDGDKVDSYIQSMVDSFGLGDEEIFSQTLEMYGRTEDDVRAMYIKQLARKGVYEAEVPVPDPTDMEIANYVSATYPTGLSTKHSYCLKMEREPDESSFDKLAEAQKIRKLLLEDGLDTATFERYVSMYCVDEDLVKRGGANGWDLDASTMPATYRGTVEDMEKGELSDVVKDDDGYYCLIWIDDVFTLPDLTDIESGTMSAQRYLADMPETLRDYFSDCTAQALWEADCEEYVAALCNGADIQIAPMPGGLPYDVDMSTAESVGEDGSDTESADSGQGRADGSSAQAADKSEG